MVERSERTRAYVSNKERIGETAEAKKVLANERHSREVIYLKVMGSVEPLRNSYKYLTSNHCVELLEKKGFFTAPASTKYHGAYQGGLFDHSLAVTKALLKLTKDNNLKGSRPESPYIIGMFHDLCKIDNYLPNIDKDMYSDGEPTAYIYNTNTLLKGHGDKSVMMIAEHTTLTEEEIMCIRYHMGAFTDKEEWNLYTRAVEKYPNVLWTHQADMIAAHVEKI